MYKLRIVVAFAAIAFVLPLAVSGQKAKPPKPPATAICTMEGDVQSGELAVTVGRDVASYGPMDQELYIDESLLPPSESPELPGVVASLKAVGSANGLYGPYYGQVRLLDDRLDYWFDTTAGCAQDITAGFACRFRLIVADGAAIYTGKGKTRTLYSIVFANGRSLLDYRWCDPTTDPDCYVKLSGCYDERDCPSGLGYVYATFEARFQ